jgi:predicted regulator of Ras-like GTPase activity (Roadblock/LC7/MglB family)
MLGSLVERIKGARGAVFCDFEGEFVELVIRDPQLSDYDMRVFGAQVAAWLNLQGGVLEMKVRCAEGTLLCRSLRDGYYLVLLLGKDVPSGVAAFELQRTAAEISREL